MPSVSQMLHAQARAKGVRQDILEKDYALSYLLAAITETPGFGEWVAIKGGTALRKLYYRDHRFSEDLDFSTIKADPLPDIAGKMQNTAEKMATMLLERGPFTVQYEPLILREPHPGQQLAWLVRVQFPHHRQPLCRLKVEITVDEQILLPIKSRPLLHSFDETLAVTIPVYDLAEIVAEKLRALLQSREKLAENGWGASRVCRDYYDLFTVLQKEGQMNRQIPELVARKCAHRKVAFASVQDFVGEDLFGVARAEWKQQLLPFVPEAPPVEQVLAAVKDMILALWD